MAGGRAMGHFIVPLWLQAATNYTNRNRKSPVFMHVVAVLRLLRLFSNCGQGPAGQAPQGLASRGPRCAPVLRTMGGSRYNATKRYGFCTQDKGCSV